MVKVKDRRQGSPSVHMFSDEVVEACNSSESRGEAELAADVSNERTDSNLQQHKIALFIQKYSVDFI